MPTLAVVTAGLSTPSTTRALADALSDAVARESKAEGRELSVETVELRDLAHELADAMTDWTSDTPLLSAAQETVTRATALIAVTPVFQGSYSGLFKMFFDTFDQHALEELPVLVAAAGGSARHAGILDYSLRPLFNYLHAVVVPTGIFQAANDVETTARAQRDRDSESARGEDTYFDMRIARAARQLTQLVVSPPQAGPAGDSRNLGNI